MVWPPPGTPPPTHTLVPGYSSFDPPRSSTAPTYRSNAILRPAALLATPAADYQDDSPDFDPGPTPPEAEKYRWFPPEITSPRDYEQQHIFDSVNRGKRTYEEYLHEDQQYLNEQEAAAAAQAEYDRSYEDIREYDNYTNDGNKLDNEIDIPDAPSPVHTHFVPKKGWSKLRLPAFMKGGRRPPSRPGKSALKGQINKYRNIERYRDTTKDLANNANGLFFCPHNHDHYDHRSQCSRMRVERAECNEYGDIILHPKHRAVREGRISKSPPSTPPLARTHRVGSGLKLTTKFYKSDQDRFEAEARAVAEEAAQEAAEFSSQDLGTGTPPRQSFRPTFSTSIEGEAYSPPQTNSPPRPRAILTPRGRRPPGSHSIFSPKAPSYTELYPQLQLNYNDQPATEDTAARKIGGFFRAGWYYWLQRVYVPFLSWYTGRDVSAEYEVYAVETDASGSKRRAIAATDMRYRTPPPQRGDAFVPGEYPRSPSPTASEKEAEVFGAVQHMLRTPPDSRPTSSHGFGSIRPATSSQQDDADAREEHSPPAEHPAITPTEEQPREEKKQQKHRKRRGALRMHPKAHAAKTREEFMFYRQKDLSKWSERAQKADSDSDSESDADASDEEVFVGPTKRRENFIENVSARADNILAQRYERRMLEERKSRLAEAEAEGRTVYNRDGEGRPRSYVLEYLGLYKKEAKAEIDEETVKLRNQAEREAIQAEEARLKAKEQARQAKEEAEAKARQAEEERKLKEAAEAKAAEAALEALQVEPQVIKRLSDEWERKIAKVMSITDLRYEVVKSVSGAPITRYSLGKILPQKGADGRSLESDKVTDKSGPTGWLDDEAVHAMFAMIVQRSREQTAWSRESGETPEMASFHPGWYTNIKQKGIASVKNWAKRQRVPGKRVLEAKTLFFPINTGAHWILVIILPQERRIELLDSANGKSEEKFKYARQWLAQELGNAYVAGEWTEHDRLSNQQTNFDDCGMFVCMNAVARAKGAPYSAVKAKDMILARKMLVALIINEGFKGELEL